MEHKQKIKERIGFIGPGIMGRPMILNLLRAGYPVQVFGRNAGVIEALSSSGATYASSPATLASANDIIICMLPDSPQVETVTLGHDGIVTTISSGKLFIDMSTVDVATELKIHHEFTARGADTLDAPVSGGQKGAEEGTLSIMAGGSPAAFTRAIPVLEALGSRITHMGDIGAGQITKSCNQIATALATQGIVEAFTLAKSAGIELNLLREAMLGGFAESKVLKIAGEKMIRRQFEPGFRMKLYQKDLRIAKAAAKLHALDLPGMQLMFEEMTTCIHDGDGELDFSALIRLFE